MESQSQRQEQPQGSGHDAKAPFSLSPAIFTPFAGVSPSQEPALDQTQQLQKIIENLKTQQDAVRKNMLFLIQQRADNLKSKAREELATLETDDDDDDDESQLDEEDKERKEREKIEMDQMFQRLRAPAMKDAKSEDYLAKPDDFTSRREDTAVSRAGSDGDVEMGGIDKPPKPRTGKVVREELSRDIRELVDRGTRELEGYDAHSKEVLSHYRQALERRTGRPAQPPTAPKGILKNTTGDGGSASRLKRRTSAVGFALPGGDD